MDTKNDYVVSFNANYNELKLTVYIILQHENERAKEKTSQVEDIGLALWKLHVKSDEQKLIEQHNFLQCVARSPN